MQPQDEQKPDQNDNPPIMLTDQSMKQTNPSNTYKPLDFILYLIIFGLLCIIGVFVLVYLIAMMSASPGVGMMILIAIPAIFAVGILSLAYLLGVAMFYAVTRSTPPLKHLIAVVIIIIINFIPPISPIQYLGMFAYNSFVEPAVRAYNDSQYEGPTDAQINAVTMSSMTEARSLLDQCHVYYIDFETFDPKGSYKLNNIYIRLNMWGHVTYQQDPNVYIPPDINIPVSDYDNLKTAVEEKNKRLNGPWQSCSHEINLPLLPEN